MSRRALAIGVLLALCVSAVHAEETTYQILFTRPMEPGQRLLFNGECMYVQTTSGVIFGDRVPQTTSRSIMRMESEMEVNEVDEQGRPTRTTHTLRECVISQDGREIGRADPGDILVVTRNGHLSDIQINGDPVTDHLKSMFQLMAGVDGDGATEDELYGSTRPRTVNESWPIDVQRTLEDFQSQSAQPMTADQVSGHAILKSIDEYEGQPCLRIYTEMATDGAIPGLDALAPDARLEDAGMTAKLEGLFPEDPSQPCRALSGQIEFHLVLVQGPSRLRSGTTMVVNRTMTPLDAPAMATVTEETPAGSGR